METELPTDGTDGAVVAVRDLVRRAIMRGELEPGAVLSQVRLATRFGVSRTPLREALRMLQEEGLILVERNRRARVAEFDAGDLELVYAQRVLLTAVATSLTVPGMRPNEIAAMEGTMARMQAFSSANDAEGWRHTDRAFHRLHCARAPDSVKNELDRLFERATLFRLLRLRDEPHRQSAISHDHETIMAACRARDASAAVHAVARHLSRIALALVALMVPEHEPQTIRTALRVILGEHDPATVSRIDTSAFPKQ